MTPKGAQGEPKVSPRGSQGAKVDAQEGQNMQKLIVQNREKNSVFSLQKLRSGGQFWAMLAHVGSSWVHVGAFWVIIGP